MPMVYTLAPATAGNTTTNSTAGNEGNTFTVKPGVRNVSLREILVVGKAAALSTLSGIVHRIVSWGTASTGGTAITPTPKDPGMQAAKQTAASGATNGSTRTNHVVFGCGAAGPGGWVARDFDSAILLPGGSAASIDALNASGTASLNFEWSAETTE